MQILKSTTQVLGGAAAIMATSAGTNAHSTSGGVSMSPFASYDSGSPTHAASSNQHHISGSPTHANNDYAHGRSSALPPDQSGGSNTKAPRRSERLRRAQVQQQQQEEDDVKMPAVCTRLWLCWWLGLCSLEGCGADVSVCVRVCVAV